jgi:hypothetical protein
MSASINDNNNTRGSAAPVFGLAAPVLKEADASPSDPEEGEGISTSPGDRERLLGQGVLANVELEVSL